MDLTKHARDRRRQVGESMIEVDHQIAESSRAYVSYPFVPRYDEAAHRDEPYWECLHLLAVLLILEPVMLPPSRQCGTHTPRSRSSYSARRNPPAENGTNSFFSYVEENLSEPCKVRVCYERRDIHFLVSFSSTHVFLRTRRFAPF